MSILGFFAPFINDVRVIDADENAGIEEGVPLLFVIGHKGVDVFCAIEFSFVGLERLEGTVLFSNFSVA